MRDTPRITLAHGGGGASMQRLIQEVLLPAYGDPSQDGREDQALLPADTLQAGERLAFTTDGFVVDPLFFPGGDIGALAVHGTVNDLACGGAEPLALSIGLILEEGLPLDTLQRVAVSIGQHARDAGVRIVTGDTKVVARGAADKMFITSAGVGRVPASLHLSSAAARPGDVLVVSGPLGNHGAAILCARNDLALQAGPRSDTRALHRATQALATACTGLRCMRDATRGGLGAILNEISAASSARIEIVETQLRVEDATRGVAELLGLDPLYLANEGVFAALVPAPEVEAALQALRSVPESAQAFVAGTVTAGTPGVVLRTALGGSRVVDLLSGEQLPRIC